MNISQKGIDFLKHEEGNVLKAYTDKAGYLTIGIGHKVVKGEFKWGDSITQEEAESLLRKDLSRIEKELALVNTVAHLNQNQYDALCSLIFNIGTGAFRNSTIRRLLLQKEFDLAADQFKVWKYITVIKAGVKTKEIDPILVARRKRERALFEEAI